MKYYRKYYKYRMFMNKIFGSGGDNTLGVVIILIIVVINSVLKEYAIYGGFIVFLVVIGTLTTNIILEINERKDKKNWIKENGSKHLNDLLEEGYGWEWAYWKERIKKDWPGWKILERPTEKEKKPDQENIKKVRHLKSEYPWAEITVTPDGIILYLANAHVKILAPKKA